MSDNKPPKRVLSQEEVERNVGLLKRFFRDIRLSWRLFWDRRVAGRLKLVPLVGLGYVILPLDIIADVVPFLGQVDDLAIFYLSLKLFAALCPPAVVNEHRQAVEGGADADAAGPKVESEGETIEAEFRVIDEEK